MSARARAGLIALCATALVLVAGAGSAWASAWWRVASRSAPTVLRVGQTATITLTATNLGDSGVNATASPVTITAVLPPGLQATSIVGAPAFHKEASYLMNCELSTLACTSKPETFPPFEQLQVTITVNVLPGASGGEADQVGVQGGEQEGQPGVAVSGASADSLLRVGESATPFGVEEHGYALTPENEDGGLDTQAGSHPFQLTTKLDLSQGLEHPRELAAAPALPKNLQFNLPPGLIGDPQAVPACPLVDFLAISEADTNACASQSAIGVAVVTLDEPLRFGDITRAVPLWNLEPAHGEPARLGFEVIKVPVVLNTSVRTGGDYGVTVSVSEAPESVQLLSSEVTIWGAPGDPAHNSSRGWACLLGGVYVNHEAPCQDTSQSPPVGAFLTLPSACTGALSSTVEGESWPLQSLASEPGQIFTLFEQAPLAGLEECAGPPFDPHIGLASSEHAASTPTGLTATVRIPQNPTIHAHEGPGEADLRDTTVTLPEGVQVNPSAANGLQACSESQIGYEGSPPGDGLAPGASEPLRFSQAPATCPEASRVGTVRIQTPLLEHELTGAVYLAEQGANPFGTLLALYISAEDPYSGIRVKLAGKATLDPHTGQITTSFENSPQVPFETLTLELFPGPRASLSTPPACKAYASSATFTPWSAPEHPAASIETTEPEQELDITTGAEGSPCANPQPFAPALNGGVDDLQAGAFSSFSLTLTHPDQDQPLTGLTLTLPPGAAALLSAVTPCGEPEASLGTCPPSSLIGEATAVAGLGPDPYTVTGGKVYITGAYDGSGGCSVGSPGCAPYGLSIVTPAVAGPFNLGDVVVRSKIEVNPHTAQVTITSPLPTIVQGVGQESSGIPLALKQIHVTVNRPNFEYNPTNCNPLSITASLRGSQGATAQSSSRFQVEGCQSLPFAPGVTAATRGQTSKADGASLALKFKSKTGEAHVAKTVLTIPATLPARLTTIQKACVAGVFEANPAACPEGSDIGTATVHTPVLKGPLSGPIYLVSHGNAAWPDAELVLQGEGITVILDGQTAIKKGITTSSFLSVPDAPFESVEATLPEGPHSALTTNLPLKDHYSLCGAHLAIPAQLTGQNNTTVEDNAKVSVQGCHATKASKTRRLTRAQKLARALKACRRDHRQSHAEQAHCERVARRRDRPKTRASHL
ncbi:MAG TPA: hypothetical protein VMB51_13910 [Solirubrobacteraceae bacterium]|nr:hypothetical protein [Solirubrobacteraceae bacterium]